MRRFSKGKSGATALMCAAYNGHETCVELLPSQSDALAIDYKEFTASGWSKKDRTKA